MSQEHSPQDYLNSASAGTVSMSADELVVTPEGAEHLANLRANRVAAHRLALDLGALRDLCGVTQVQLAQATGRVQSHISKIEAAPTRVQMATLIAYLQGLGAHASLVIERDGATYDLELV